MPDTITATYRIVTPMFIGGADQTPQDGIRPPAVKGALRFWWRALQWETMLREQTTTAAALHALHRKEAALFGIAADDNQARRRGQGVFLLHVKQPLQSGRETQWPQNNTGSGYLGFGLMATQDTRHREGLLEGSEFTLTLRFRPNTPATDRETLRDCLQAWSLFGGLGGRARRGFGSVTLRELDGEDQQQDAASYHAQAQAVLNTHAHTDPFPPYTAFTQQARFGILHTADQARQAHEQAGLAYKTYRGQPSQLRGRDKLPFGLPLQGVDTDNRRASPLFFHIHALRNEQYAAAVLFLPATFHHERPYQYEGEHLTQFNQVVARFVPQQEPNP